MSNYARTREVLARCTTKDEQLEGMCDLSKELEDQVGCLTADNEEYERVLLQVRIAMGLHRDSNDHIVEYAAKLKAERDALKLDAERYRWLRNPLSDTSYLLQGPLLDELLSAEDLDAAIDAARKP